MSGSSSVVHGGGAFGGVMEMRTKDARDLLRPGEQFGTRIKLAYNDNNRSHAAAHVFGSNAARSFDCLVSVLGTSARTHELSSGLEVPTRNDKREGMLKLRYEPAADHELHFKLQGSRMDVQNPWNTLWRLTEWAGSEITGTHQQQDPRPGTTRHRIHGSTWPWTRSATARNATARSTACRRSTNTPA